jgi:hypothetical protein
MRGEPRDPRDFDLRGGPPPNRLGGGPPVQQGNLGGNVQDALANLLQQVQSQGGPAALANESMRTQVLEALKHNPQLVQSLVQKMPPSSQLPQQQGMPYPQSSMPLPNPSVPPMHGMPHQQQPPHNPVMQNAPMPGGPMPQVWNLLYLLEYTQEDKEKDEDEEYYDIYILPLSVTRKKRP